MSESGIRKQFAGAVGGLILTALSCHAQGTVVYRDLGSFWLLGNANVISQYNLDFNEDGQDDFIIEAGESLEAIGLGENATYSIPQPPGELGADVVPLTFGTSIEPQLPNRRFWYQTEVRQSGPNTRYIGSVLHYVLDLGAGGLWLDGTMAYMGAEFDIDGRTHYGWLRIEIPDPLRGNSGIIHDVAYNTVPGEMIFAGQVPEPSTWALLIGGGAILFWRYRRGYALRWVPKITTRTNNAPRVKLLHVELWTAVAER